jgi:hypothetical protein
MFSMPPDTETRLRDAVPVAGVADAFCCRTPLCCSCAIAGHYCPYCRAFTPSLVWMSMFCACTLEQIEYAYLPRKP